MGAREADLRDVEAKLQTLDERRQKVLAEFEAFRLRAEAELTRISQQVRDLTAVQKFLSAREGAEMPSEYVNGIDVARLDHETKILVLAGNPDTLAVLRRNPALVQPGGSVESL